MMNDCSAQRGVSAVVATAVAHLSRQKAKGHRGPSMQITDGCQRDRQRAWGTGLPNVAVHA
jgi:hypothetical protein